MSRDLKSGSGKENALSIPYLKAFTNKFDIETIFVLNLSNQSLMTLGSIGECTNLIFLDLSQNKIKDLVMLAKLTKLQVIKLGKNFISSIEPLKQSTKMLHIDLHGNSIKGVKSLAGCKDMYYLSSIYLMLMDGQFKNPICEEEGYRNKVFEQVPQLKRLDGVAKNKKVNFDAEIKVSKSIEFKLEPSNVSWYTKEYPAVDFSSKQSATLDDQAAKKSLDSCNDVIKNIEKQLARLNAK